MNILIPIGGIGKRFSDEGYSSPKPLIKVLGIPMIQRVIASLKTNSEDLIHIVFNPELNQWNFTETLQKEFPEKNFRFVQLEKQTRGAAETILHGLRGLDPKDLNRGFLIVDCDTFYSDDVVGKYKVKGNSNLIFYFKDTEEKPIFSYINLDESGRVIEIKEKIKISNNANCGAYGFQSGDVLEKYCKSILNKEGELYVSRVYDEMIQSGETVLSSKIEGFDCVGTPLQLRVFCESNKPESKIRICFDLDNTLVTFPTKPNDYSTILPIQKNIDYANFLKSQGAHIIIHTARRMKTHKGNVGAIISDIGKVTLETLDKFGIPYDEIFFGKPHAHFYIDDLAVNAFDSLDKEIGFYKTQSEARDFNSVEFTQDEVIKKTANKGEIFWYQNIPKEISFICPKLIASDFQSGLLKLERVKGINLSYLYTNFALQVKDIQNLLHVMNGIHGFKPDVNLSIDVNGNYSKKLEERFSQHSNRYSKISQHSFILYSTLAEKLSEYEKLEKNVCLIHGDPVFTNIISTHNGLRLIDPRGKVGNDLTIFGDVNYDLAKIYQSILGYDFILNDVEINFEYVQRMREAFESQFGKDDLNSIRLITASLFFSLIPLHTFSEKKFKKYFSIIESLLECL
jgi:capsule biosynthesis phosphatase